MFSNRRRIFALAWVLMTSVITGGMLWRIPSLYQAFNTSNRDRIQSLVRRPGAPAPQFSAAPVQPPVSLTTAIVLVIVVMAISLAVLWILNKKIASPQKDGASPATGGTFSGKWAAAGASLAVGASGLLGAFMVISVTTLAMVIVIVRYL